MTKTDLINKVAADAGIKKASAKAAVESVLASIKDAVAAGETVQLIGFGSFKYRVRPAGKRRNPATGKTIKCPAKKYPVFKAGKAFADQVK